MQDVRSPLFSSPLYSSSQVYHFYLLIFFHSSSLLLHSLFSHSFLSLPKSSLFHLFVLSYSFSTSVSFFPLLFPFNPLPFSPKPSFPYIGHSTLVCFLSFHLYLTFSSSFYFSTFSTSFPSLLFPSPPFLSLLLFLIYIFHVSFLCFYLFLNFPSSFSLLPYSFFLLFSPPFPFNSLLLFLT